MASTQRIRTTVSGPTEPKDTHVFWVDTSNPESPVLKMFNGGWVAVSEPEGGGGSSCVETTGYSWIWQASSGWSTKFDTAAEVCEFVGISEEQLAAFLSGESRADLLAYWDFDGANMESILRYEKREYQEGVSLVQWLFYNAGTYEFKEIEIMSNDDGYTVRGLGN